MKTKPFILSILVVATLFASPTIGYSFLSKTEKRNSITLNQEVLKIEADQLPDAVKKTILNDERTSSLRILEAWQVVDEDSNLLYRVKFDNEGEGFWRKYDSRGNEIED